MKLYSIQVEEQVMKPHFFISFLFANLELTIYPIAVTCAMNLVVLH